MHSAAVDFFTVCKLLVAVVFVGVGGTAVFSQGVVSLERVATARQQQRIGIAVVHGLIVALAVLFWIAMLAGGVIAMRDT